MKLAIQDKATFRWRVRKLLEIFSLFVLIVVAAMVAFQPARENGLLYLAAGFGVTCVAIFGTYIFALLEDRESEQRIAEKRAQEQTYRRL
jgi:hypothetical protein